MRIFFKTNILLNIVFLFISIRDAYAFDNIFAILKQNEELKINSVFDSKTINLIPKNALIEVLNKKDDNEIRSEYKETWRQIKYRGQVGWIFTKQSNIIYRVPPNEYYSVYEGDLFVREELYLALQSLFNSFDNYCHMQFQSKETFKSGDGDQVFYERYFLEINADLDIIAFSSKYDMNLHRIISLQKEKDRFILLFVNSYDQKNINKIVLSIDRKMKTISWKLQGLDAKQLFFTLTYSPIQKGSVDCNLSADSWIRRFL
ncbi:hypothetical protein CH370_09725 [Leptospira kmetyi]|nr:hypothetical protein CH370_09725 [Leptospira kmetyi]